MVKEKQNNNKGKPPWLVDVTVAISLLVLLLGIVTFLYGKDIIERPILAFFVLLAWLGALVGLKIPDDRGIH